jgi:capsular polysaccharide biosynthesis protein
MTEGGTNSYAYRNPLDLPRIAFSDIVANGAEGVFVEEPGSPRRFTRSAPTFHDDPDGVGLFPAFQDLAVVSPPVFTASLRHVTLAGFRSILRDDGTFINDLGHLTPQDCEGFVSGLGASNELGPLRPTATPGVFAGDLDAYPQVRLDGPVVLLTSAEPGNFGSFLYREIVKWLNVRHGPDAWRLLVHLPNRSFEDLLELAGAPMDRVIRHDIHTVYRIEQAIAPGVRAPFAFLDPQMRALFAAMREKCATGERGRRIYVSRLSVSAINPNGRVMRNEAEFSSRLKTAGFERVEPEQLSARQQIALFASADFVLGPSGSGMFNCVFCRPGTKLVDIESEPHWIYPHCNLFASSGLDYAILEGRAEDRDFSVHHKPWRVDIDAVLKRIASWDERGDAPAVVEAADGPAEKARDAGFWTMRAAGGEGFLSFLQRVHRTLRPQTYLEIGVAQGSSLELAHCASIGVDPAFAIERPIYGVKPACLLYRMTSDDFFRRYDPTVILGQPIDLAFLDGLHWYEALLRDFINTERHCKPNSVIFLHDCLPPDAYVGRRLSEDHRRRNESAYPDWWAGDVWKVLSILLAHRPDLKIEVFDCAPTGLVAVSNLNPQSTTLEDRFSEIVAGYKDATLGDDGDALFGRVERLDPSRFTAPELASRFPL